MKKNSFFLTKIIGDNFSGRSNYLKSLLVDPEENNLTNIYIGEQPSNYITGIFPTVKSEIDLHVLNTESEIRSKVFDLFSIYNFEKHQSKNPFTLSGGEQSILVILSNLLLQPQKIAIDTTIEQLNAEWRTPLLSAIQKGDFGCSNIYLSDNRLREYNIQDAANIFPPQRDITYNLKFEKPSRNHEFQTSIEEKNIELSGLSFGYSKNDIILDKINISLKPGNIYHLKGSNGSGKSTFAKVLTGILKVKNGHLFVNNKKYDTYNYPGSLVGYSFQNPDEQLFSSTVEKEVLIPIKNESVEYTRKRDLFINMFGLRNIRNCHPAELPFVIRKRIALAATLAMDRAWYVLDEPTLGQDDSFIIFLVELLNSLLKQGKGIIVISHSEYFIEKLNLKSLSLQNKKILQNV